MVVQTQFGYYVKVSRTTVDKVVTSAPFLDPLCTRPATRDIVTRTITAMGLTA